MTILIILFILFFATLSVAPLLVGSDPDARACIILPE
jgi:hypothetical protein